MDLLNTLAFLVFPYIALTVFVVGHGLRYITGGLAWNAGSSQLLDSAAFKWAIVTFHVGVILTFVGHFGGLLIPQGLYDAVGIDTRAHLQIALWSGLVVGGLALAGVVLLWRRRRERARIRIQTTRLDRITLGWLMVTIATGFINVLISHHNVLETVAPWIRGIVTFTPDAALMKEVPFLLKLHILSALGLLGFSPFTRLVHIWSVPLTYLFRRPLVYSRMRAAS